VRERLDEQPRPLGGQGLAHVARDADGIAHVVQGVEEGHEVVARARIVLGARGLESNAVADPSRFAAWRATSIERAW